MKVCWAVIFCYPLTSTVLGGSMRSLIGSLFLVFSMTACAPLSKHDSVLGEGGRKGEQQKEESKQQEEYNTWWQSLTPEQRVREIEKQHERALSP